MSIENAARDGHALFVAPILVFACTLVGLLPRPASADLSTMLGSKTRASSVVIQPDGKILTVGLTLPDDTTPYLDNDLALTRVLPDGSPDPDFGTAGVVIRSSAADYYYAAPDLALQSDGRILVVGNVSGGQSLMRLLSNGTLDTSFGVGGIAPSSLSNAYAIAIQADGRIVVGGPNYVARYLSDGTLDATFGTAGMAETPPDGTDWEVNDLAIQPDGKIVAAAGLYSIFTVGRLNADGTLDDSFDGDGLVTIADQRGLATGVAVQPDGRILVSGATQPEFSSNFRATLARFEADGSPDTSFGIDGVGRATLSYISTPLHRLFTMELQADGKALMVGNCLFDFDVVRFTTSGEVDTTFGDDGIVHPDLGGQHWYSQNGGCDVAIQDDGGIIAAGMAEHGNYQSTTLVRLTSNGDLDSTFEDDGIAIESDCRRFPLDPSDCLVASRSDLKFSSILYSTVSDRRSLQWKWKAGPAFDEAVLGTPGVDTRYTLCIYDTSAGEQRLATWMDLYGQVPKWSEQPHGGWSYSNTMEPWKTDGISRLSVKAGLATRAMLRGKYYLLPLPTAVSASKWFHQDPELIVQLVNSDGFCLQSEFPASSTRTDTGTEFNASTRLP